MAAGAICRSANRFHVLAPIRWLLAETADAGGAERLVAWAAEANLDLHDLRLAVVVSSSAGFPAGRRLALQLAERVGTAASGS